MRIYWSKEEELCLKHYYEDLGLSISEFIDDFSKKYPARTKISVEVKIRKLKLRHTKKQIYDLKYRLNTGEKNGMYGKVGPNNGLKKDNSERVFNASKKISETRKKLFKTGILDVSGEKNGMYGKKSWNKGKTKYTDDRIERGIKKISISRKNTWNNLSQEKKDIIIGKLSLAANKAKKDTKIEIIIKNILEKMNIKFIKNYSQSRFIFDFYLIDYNFVIECQGDYWHGNPEYFTTLNDIQSKNIVRDKLKMEYLINNNIKSLFLWENEIYKNKEKLEKIISEKIK
jgi:G:T-mismatch repair DNA endonuclease (very short patch repair protein)